MAKRVGQALRESLETLQALDPDALVQQRHQRLNRFGEFTEK